LEDFVSGSGSVFDQSESVLEDFVSESGSVFDQSESVLEDFVSESGSVFDQSESVLEDFASVHKNELLCFPRYSRVCISLNDNKMGCGHTPYQWR
jgi:hypothetical protein